MQACPLTAKAGAKAEVQVKVSSTVVKYLQVSIYLLVLIQRSSIHPRLGIKDKNNDISPLGYVSTS